VERRETEQRSQISRRLIRRRIPHVGIDVVRLLPPGSPEVPPTSRADYLRAGDSVRNRTLPGPDVMRNDERMKEDLGVDAAAASRGRA